MSNETKPTVYSTNPPQWAKDAQDELRNRGMLAAGIVLSSPSVASIIFAHAPDELKWVETDDGDWEAASVLHDEGVPFMWRVTACSVGGWTPYKSDAERDAEYDSGRGYIYAELDAAKAWCQHRENELRKPQQENPDD